jgi:hypothetical protein
MFCFAFFDEIIQQGKCGKNKKKKIETEVFIEMFVTFFFAGVTQLRGANRMDVSFSITNVSNLK